MKVPVSYSMPMSIILTFLAADHSEAFMTQPSKSLLSLSSPPITTNDQQQEQHHHQQQYGRISSPLSPATSRRQTQTSTALMYEPSSNNNDPQKEAQDALNSGFWNALSYTEQWISETLKEASREGKSNPYARKELNYVCEMNNQILAAVAGIFRRFREAREMGERHSFAEEEMIRLDPRHERTTLRQTQVIIVPFCDFFDTFQAYEGVIQAINLARKNARDLVTDASIEKMELMEREWDVSINGASLHPCYGEKTPKEIIDELEEIEEDGMLDLNKVEGMRRRNQARRSPYPTLIIEVQASPPGENDINDRKSPPQSASDDDDNDLSRRGVLNDIVLKLESIFAKSAAIHKKNDIKEENSEDSFYKAIGRSSGVEEVLASSPIAATQQWVIDNDPLYNSNISSFTSADVTHADSAFEFVFSNLAMNKFLPNSGERRKNYDISSRSYLIMPKFVSSSATSLEKFMADVKNIIEKIDGLNERVSLSMMHPEHVRDERRSPVPVIAIQWYAEREK